MSYLEFWRSESEIGLKLKSKCQQVCITSIGSRRNPLPCLFQLLGAAYSCWLRTPSSYHSNLLLPSSHFRLFPLTLLPPSYKHLCRCIGSAPMIQNNFFLTTPLTVSAESLLAMESNIILPTTVTMDKLLNLTESQFLQVQNEDKNTYLAEL